MKFKDLVFEPHAFRKQLTIGDVGFGEYDNHTHAIWEENGVKISIIHDGKTYQVLLIGIDGKEVSSMPIGNMRAKQVVRFINKACAKDDK